MRAVALLQTLLGLGVLAAMPAAGRGLPAAAAAFQVLGGLGLLAVAAVAARVPRDREIGLWGWTGAAAAAWTFVACFAAALAGRHGLVAADLALGLASSGLGSWVALRPAPPAVGQPSRPVPEPPAAGARQTPGAGTVPPRARV